MNKYENNKHLTNYIKDLVAVHSSLGSLKKTMAEDQEYEYAIEVRDLQEKIKELSNKISKRETPKNDAAVVIVLNKDNKILLLKRGETAPSFPSYWDLPGGVMEENEEPTQAARRELEEETSIKDVTLFQPSCPKGYPMRTRKGKVFNFLVKLEDNHEVKIDWEHSEFKWVDLKDIEGIKIIPLQKDIIRDFKIEEVTN